VTVGARRGDAVAARASLRRDLARWAAPAVPRLYAAAAFVAGAVLLVSGATPRLTERMVWLRRLVPLPVVEGSHFLGSVVGAALLVVAGGLAERLDGAWAMSVVLLAAGAVLSLVKGLDYEEALLLLVLLAALLPARRRFDRRASMFHRPQRPGWMVAAALTVTASIVLGFFAYRHVVYSDDLWWRFTFLGHAPRFLRASLGASAIVLVAGLRALLRPARRRVAPPTASDLAAASAVLARSPEAHGWLALLGDKSFQFDAERSAFVMFAVRRRSWVALGDPVGPPEAREALCWAFRERVDREGGRVAFYDVGPESLPLYLDLGLSLLKLGDRARVPLLDFSLEGHERRALRHTVRRAEKDGASFEVVPPGRRVRALLPELRAVSDEWLARRRSREKGFSMGFFDEGYLARCPLAVVRREHRIVAFANLWLGAPDGDLMIDLMRFSSRAPKGTMDYLFACVMAWGKQQGSAWFDLGMAPLSGLSDHALSPVWSRIGALLYHHGEEFYHFRGLRQFKAKFGAVWQPRFLASSGGFGVAEVLVDLAALHERGPRAAAAAVAATAAIAGDQRASEKNFAVRRAPADVSTSAT
jgi:phosphatidylglycerol lysyltransferase